MHKYTCLLRRKFGIATWDCVHVYNCNMISCRDEGLGFYNATDYVHGKFSAKFESVALL